MTRLSVNGKNHSVNADPDMPLLWVLREELQLTGTKFGCGMALCGACTVHLDGQAVRSCATPLSAAAGKAVTTIEGIGASRTGKTVQAAWTLHDVPQCGYCQSGQIMSACALLAREQAPERRRHRRRDERQHLPLRHLQPDSRCDQGRGGESACARRVTVTTAAFGTGTRRAFLKRSASAALVIGFTLPVEAARLRKTVLANAEPFAPNAWLRITPDNRITVLCGSAEMGQGVLTAIPMLIAEELDADWDRVSVERAPVDKAYDNPMFGLQATGGSTTIRAHWVPLRQAGAAAREMLVAAAAAHWKLDTGLLRTEKSQVLGPNGRRLSYGALIGSAAKQAVPASPRLKPQAEFRLLGKPLKRLDTPQKVNGSAKYGIDAQVSGLLIAVMARAPLPGAKATGFNEAAARAIAGVHNVLSIPNGVAVLADGYWAAKRGRDALEVQWDLGPLAALSSQDVSEQLNSAATNADASARDDGNVRDAAANSTLMLDATYEAPYLAHACMEPMNCTAHVRGDEVEIWAGTQSPGPAKGILGQLAQVAPERVR